MLNVVMLKNYEQWLDEDHLEARLFVRKYDLFHTILHHLQFDTVVVKQTSLEKIGPLKFNSKYCELRTRRLFCKWIFEILPQQIGWNDNGDIQFC